MKQKKYENYMDQLCKLHPYMKREELDYIIRYGLNTYYEKTKEGFDIDLKEDFSKKDYFSCFLGIRFFDKMKEACYANTRIGKKLRYFMETGQIKWDGYNYFALNDEQYEMYLKQKDNYIISFNDLKVYRIKKEVDRRYSFMPRFRINNIIRDKYYQHFRHVEIQCDEILEL